MDFKHFILASVPLVAFVACSDDDGTQSLSSDGGEEGGARGGRASSAGGRSSGAGGRASSTGGRGSGGTATTGGSDGGVVITGGATSFMDAGDSSAGGTIADAALDAQSDVGAAEAALADVTDARTEPPDARDAPSAALVCQEACQTDEDCERGGLRVGLSCDNERCVFACESNAHCTDQSVINAGNTCTMDSDCVGVGPPNAVCATLADGNDYCVSIGFIPPDNGCPRPKVTRPRADGTGDVEVCVTTTTTVCSRTGECVEPCSGTCGENLPQTCDEATGECLCASDDDCAGVSGKPECNLETGQCVCGDDEDCEPGERCRDGECRQGCDSADDCGEATLDGTTVLCE